MMNIVIMGCDNSGKTTLSTKLAEKLNGECIHSLGPVSVEKMKEFMENETTHTGVKIFDRFPIIEEAIYGTILRGNSKFTDEEYNIKMLDKIDLFIYCNPGIESIANWGEREQMDGVIENYKKITDAFDSLSLWLALAGFNVKKYNYNTDNWEELVE